MRTLFVGSLLVIALFAISTPARAQVEELEQLALDIEKLAQMKSILQEMYKGYQILSGGYNTIKSLAEGNFNLHNAFLSSLLSVSPTVKNYVRIADIIAAQSNLLTEYKSAQRQFILSGAFSPTELNYMASVYGNLVNRSIDNLDELAMILTDNTLRMSDAERLGEIDHIYTDMQDKLTFLRQFNGKAGMLGSQRQSQMTEITTLQSLFGK